MVESQVGVLWVGTEYWVPVVVTGAHEDAVAFGLFAVEIVAAVVELEYCY